MAVVTVSRTRAVAIVAISHAQTRNGLSLELWSELAETVERLGDDSTVHAIAIVSGVPGVWCAGMNLTELRAHVGDSGWLARAIETVGRACERIAAVATPTVAVIEGSCVGGGVALATACHLRIAASAATFAIPPVVLGIPYPVVPARALAALVGIGQARRLLLTAAPLDADEALRIGLVEERAERADAFERIAEIATRQRDVLRTLTRVTGDDANEAILLREALSGGAHSALLE